VKVKTIEMARTVNLGNYSNLRLGAVAELEPDESPTEAVKKLSHWLSSVVGTARQSCTDESGR
jgi:hypothetical protein